MVLIVSDIFLRMKSVLVTCLKFFFVVSTLSLPSFMYMHCFLKVLPFCSYEHFMEYLLRTVTVPSREFGILLFVVAYKLNRIWKKITNFLRVIKNQHSPSFNFRLNVFIVYSGLPVVYTTVAIPILYIHHLSNTVRILALCIAVLVLDSSIMFSLYQFILKVFCQSSLLSTFDTTSNHSAKNTVLKNPIQSCLIVMHRFNFRFWDKTVNFMIKLLVLGVGATSGHANMENTCLLAIFHLFAYVFALVVSVYAFTGFVIVSGPVALPDTPQPLNTEHHRSWTSARVRSSSCSIHQTSYAERRPVVMTSVPDTNPQPSLSLENRLKWITILGLTVLYAHSRYMAIYHTDQGSSISSSSHHPSEFRSINKTLSHLISQLLYLSPHISWNMLLFLLVCMLLGYRIRLHAHHRRELLHLDVQGVMPTDRKPSSVTLPEVSPSVRWRKMPSVPLAAYGTTPLMPSSTTVTTGNDQSTAFTAELESKPISDAADCLGLINQGLGSSLSDRDILDLISRSKIKTRDLETIVRNPLRAVELRRAATAELLTNPLALDNLPFKQYDYRFVYGQCCEEVIGYIPIPVGKVGPLLLDGRSHYLSLATTEGCLVASTNRGCRALFLAGGVKSVVFRDQMTRAPVVRFGSLTRLTECIAWIESSEGFQALKNVFEQTSAHISLLSIFSNPAGRYLHIRFAARTGDAMGMNMVSKATNSALRELKRYFPDMQVISLSGNMCTDKKPAVINSLLGRGKSVIAEAILPSTVLAQVLHTNATRLALLGHAKNWIGSGLAGCPGMIGSNAHAANLIAGLFAATGQDLAQVVDASACLTQLEAIPEDDSLLASVTMPCLEVGTIGGGTRLPAQRACIDLLDLCVERPTEHLARLFAGAVLAGELSLLAALDTDDLVTSHLRLNRAKEPIGNSLGGNSTVSEPYSASANAVAASSSDHLHAVM